MNRWIQALVFTLALTSCKSAPNGPHALEPELQPGPRPNQLFKLAEAEADRPRKKMPTQIVKPSDNRAEIDGTIAVEGKIEKSKTARSDLRGTCLYGDPEHTYATSACVQANVELLSLTGETVATSVTNGDGRFRFYAMENVKYLVRLTDHKKRAVTLRSPVGRGDLVSIYLLP